MKKLNNYQQAIDQGFYEKAPKAVLAAIAVSMAINNGEDATEYLKREWQTLYNNGIISQKPQW